MELALAAAALAVTWLVYRLQQYGSRTRDIEATRASLLAIKGALVEKPRQAADDPQPPQPAWGDIYFTTVYDAKGLNERAHAARRQSELGVFDLVFVVPTEPIELLATSPAGEDLISAETIYAANLALWRLHVFNQLVMQQTVFNAVTYTDRLDASVSRKRHDAIAEAAAYFSLVLHKYGVDGVAAEGGWYQRLTAALEKDIDRLTRLRGFSLDRFREQPFLVFADVLVLGLAATFGALGFTCG